MTTKVLKSKLNNNKVCLWRVLLSFACLFASDMAAAASYEINELGNRRIDFPVQLTATYTDRAVVGTDSQGSFVANMTGDFTVSLSAKKIQGSTKSFTVKIKHYSTVIGTVKSGQSGVMHFTAGTPYIITILVTSPALSDYSKYELTVAIGSGGGGGGGGGGDGSVVKITFVANGGHIGNGSATSSSTFLLSGDYFGYDVPLCSRKGYAFAGWYTKKSGGTMVSSSSKVPSHSTTYYARWTANKYKIKFNANGGKGTMKPQSAKYGKTVKLRANAFKKSKYKFAGWAKKKSGKVAYKNKAKVKNLTSKNGKRVTLYAVWKKAK